MRSAFIVLAAAVGLAGCANPVAQQATVDTRYDPIRADSMLAVNFGPGSTGLTHAQASEFKTMVAAGRRAQRDEFVVVSDGSVLKISLRNVPPSGSAPGW